MNERIKNLRVTLDMTQKEFADALGTTQDNVSGYEIGRRNPSEGMISLIVKTFNVNETWLRTGEGEMFREVTKDERIAEFMGGILKQEPDSFRVRFISMLSRLDESDWAVLEKMALAMYEEKKKD